MNKHLRLRLAWAGLAIATLLVSALPAATRLGRLAAPYWSDNWAHFLLYGAVASIPCAAWRTRRGVALCLAALAFGVGSELLPALAARPARSLEHAISDLFGIAAGILLGLNFRVYGDSAASAGGMAAAKRGSTML